MVEKIMSDFSHAYGLKYISLRYFNAAGADIDNEIGEWHDPEMHLIPLVLDAAIGERQSIKIFGTDYSTDDGICIRGYSVKEVIEAARRVTGKKIKAVESERRPGDSEILVGSAVKAQKILGWQQQYSNIEEIIDTAWQWHQKLYSDYK